VFIVASLKEFSSKP